MYQIRLMLYTVQVFFLAGIFGAKSFYTQQKQLRSTLDLIDDLLKEKAEEPCEVEELCEEIKAEMAEVSQEQVAPGNLVSNYLLGNFPVYVTPEMANKPTQVAEEPATELSVEGIRVTPPLTDYGFTTSMTFKQSPRRKPVAKKKKVSKKKVTKKKASSAKSKRK